MRLEALRVEVERGDAAHVDPGDPHVGADADAVGVRKSATSG